MRSPILIAVGLILAFALGFAFGKTPKQPTPSVPEAAVAAVDATISPKPAAAHDDGVWYSVVKVIDGDTLVVTKDGENMTLRLIGLDTPETVDPRKPVQCFGKEASEKAKQILTGTSVRIEMDASQGALDKYGRTLAYAFLPNGTNFNELMITEGYGHEYTYNLPYKYQTKFKAAEQKAREEKRGLWNDGVCENYGLTKPVISAGSDDEIYECSRNTYNCSDFAMQAEAQAAFEACGGNANDIHKLDADLDGKVCESLP